MMTEIAYLLAGLLFIAGIKLLTRVQTARVGNRVSASAMALVVVATLWAMHAQGSGIGWAYIAAAVGLGTVIGLFASTTVKMTSMPQLVALFNGFGGGASLCVALAYVFSTPSMAQFSVVTVWISITVGAATFSASTIAFSKLQGWMKVVRVHNAVSALLAIVLVALGGSLFVVPSHHHLIWSAIAVTSLLLGISITLPVGGANMPVVIALLNSLSGVAASAAGFVLHNTALVMSGALVGASGLILTLVMCKGMNTSLSSVLFTPPSKSAATQDQEYSGVTQSSVEEAALVLDSAQSIIIVPGYGLAVAQAQHAVEELTQSLEKRKKQVKFAIHPVAGRMPGHMNVLLAEADVPYDQLFDLDSINSEFKRTDAVLVVGANDVVNPAASTKKDSPIYGMPILNVHQARSVLVVKRSLSPGFAGVKNDLFEKDNTSLVYGDAKDVLLKLSKEIDEL